MEIQRSISADAKEHLPSHSHRLMTLALWPAFALARCRSCDTNGPTSSSAAVHAAWLASLGRDRDETTTRLRYAGGVFGSQALQWTQTAYVQPQMHPYDRYFYDPVSGNYTVGRYLADLKVPVEEQRRVSSVSAGSSLFLFFGVVCSACIRSPPPPSPSPPPLLLPDALRRDRRAAHVADLYEHRYR